MNLDKEKRNRKLKYHIIYRVNGKQKWEYVGCPISEARDADGKRKVQKRENRIFEILAEAKMTFQELTNWCLSLEEVKELSSYWRTKISLEKFNSVLGSVVVGMIKAEDLEHYQAIRKKESLADNTIDHEIGAAKTMVYKAFDNDMAGAQTLRVFRKVKKMLKRNSNAWNRILSPEEFDRLRGILLNT